MEIKGIGQKLNTEALSKSMMPSEKGSKPFIDSLKESIEKVSQLQGVASDSVINLVSGKDQEIHQTMIAVEKADISFQLMMKVRNKILAAYEDISRMQI